MTRKERTLEGIPVSPGIAIGHTHVLNKFGETSVEMRGLKENEIEPEIERFKHAVEVSRLQLSKIYRQVAEALDERHAEIYSAQAKFLDDPSLIDDTIQAIRRERKNAEYLFNRKINEFLTILSQFEDEFFKARDNDILDIANRINNNLAQRTTDTAPAIPPQSVIISTDMTPSETASLTKQKVIAFVIEKGGPTSHTAIMAKAMEIPAVVCVADLMSVVTPGCQVIVDGINGKVVFNPTSDTIAHYKREQINFSAFERELDQLRDQPAETLDGYSIELRANVELPDEVIHAAEHGARGIGLFRTEFIFMNRETPPTENEQFEIYRVVVEQVKPHPVVFRTLDLGGDKFYGPTSGWREQNPFMGQRAVRLCFEHPDIFDAQLRALLRASAFGTVRILIPMISGVEEFVQVKQHIKRAKAELKHLKIEFGKNVEVGVMIEVPSAAVIADDLARECDFFSIGTNDLIQYTLAVDRGNERVAYLYEPLHPAILRLLKGVIVAARKGGISVSVCGEMGGDPVTALILLGMGADELSMSAVSVPHIKKLVRSLRLPDAKALAEELVSQPTIDDVKRVVKKRLKNYLRGRFGS